MSELRQVEPELSDLSEAEITDLAERGQRRIIQEVNRKAAAKQLKLERAQAEHSPSDDSAVSSDDGSTRSSPDLISRGMAAAGLVLGIAALVTAIQGQSATDQLRSDAGAAYESVNDQIVGVQNAAELRDTRIASLDERSYANQATIANLGIDDLRAQADALSSDLERQQAALAAAVETEDRVTDLYADLDMLRGRIGAIEETVDEIPKNPIQVSMGGNVRGSGAAPRPRAKEVFSIDGHELVQVDIWNTEKNAVVTGVAGQRQVFSEGDLLGEWIISDIDWNSQSVRVERGAEARVLMQRRGG